MVPAVKLLIIIGISCTLAYPRGFKITKGAKKNPVHVCINGELGATWRTCELRYRA